MSRSQPTPRGRKNAGIAGSEAAATSDVGSSPPGDNGEPSDGETLEATGRGWSEVVRSAFKFNLVLFVYVLCMCSVVSVRC